MPEKLTHMETLLPANTSRTVIGNNLYFGQYILSVTDSFQILSTKKLTFKEMNKLT